MKFLIVDDERDVEMLFRQKLRREIREGLFELEFAFSGNEALEKLRSHNPPEVLYIFSDINMPGMTGLELLEKVKTEFPTIQVSMISAYGDSENHDRAMSSGAKEFFTKPVDFDTIKAEMHQILTGSK
ncbi:response regulator [Mariniradius sediminis]|uniref:Response regulator n=1 Tax=Mariniradius sediminis TaxID=2909237 RepID=A0ABS9BVB9_9BACT|nr:response regulator [Mariniradius sediminis]MCF1751642.1 response regulator [Mariniradius sediminis]